MKIELLSVMILAGGKEAELLVELSEDGQSDRRRFTVPKAVFDGLGLCEGEITRDDMSDIMEADERYRAIKKAFDIIAFGKNSKKMLSDKLRHRGFDPEIAEDVAEYMEAHGYINEGSDAEREVDLCLKKLWGSRRILMHLHQRGFDASAIDSAKKYMESIDFVDVCVRLVREKYTTLPKIEAERQKVISALVRHGFSINEIKAAAKIIEYYKLPE